VKKIQNKIFLLASMKSLVNCENCSNSPLQGACSGFPKAACDSKIKSAHDKKKIVSKADLVNCLGIVDYELKGTVPRDFFS
jgi:hypothetical protein